MTEMLRELAEEMKQDSLAGAHLFLRTHHAEIAQNAEAAKRLRALEMALDNWDADYGTTDGLCIRERADEIMRGDDHG